MDKLEFNQLELQKQVQYINDQLCTGLSITKVCKDIGIDRSTVRKRFDNGGYSFNKDLNLYEGGILNEGNTNKTAPTPNKKPPKKKTNTNTLEERVKALESQLEALQQIVHSNTNNTVNANDVNNKELELLDFNGDTVTRAYRMYEDVQKDFKIFCKKHSEYKVQDIISTALVEFMNKKK